MCAHRNGARLSTDDARRRVALRTSSRPTAAFLQPRTRNLAPVAVLVPTATSLGFGIALIMPSIMFIAPCADQVVEDVAAARRKVRRLLGRTPISSKTEGAAGPSMT